MKQGLEKNIEYRYFVYVLDEGVPWGSETLLDRKLIIKSLKTRAGQTRWTLIFKDEESLKNFKEWWIEKAVQQDSLPCCNLALYTFNHHTKELVNTKYGKLAAWRLVQRKNKLLIHLLVDYLPPL